VGASDPKTGVVVGMSFCRTRLGAGAGADTGFAMFFLSIAVTSSMVFITVKMEVLSERSGSDVDVDARSSCDAIDTVWDGMGHAFTMIS